MINFPPPYLWLSRQLLREHPFQKALTSCRHRALDKRVISLVRFIAPETVSDCQEILALIQSTQDASRDGFYHLYGYSWIVKGPPIRMQLKVRYTIKDMATRKVFKSVLFRVSSDPSNALPGNLQFELFRQDDHWTVKLPRAFSSIDPPYKPHARRSFSGEIREVVTGVLWQVKRGMGVEIYGITPRCKEPIYEEDVFGAFGNHYEYQCRVKKVYNDQLQQMRGLGWRRVAYERGNINRYVLKNRERAFSPPGKISLTISPE